MATDQLINKTQGDAIIAGLAAIKNAINDQPVPTQVEDVVSDAFDVGVSYVPGDYCIYENKLYKCDVAHHGAWDGNDFTLTNVGAELDTLNNALTKRETFTLNLSTYPCTTSGYNGYLTNSISTGKAKILNIMVLSTISVQKYPIFILLDVSSNPNTFKIWLPESRNTGTIELLLVYS